MTIHSIVSVLAAVSALCAAVSAILYFIVRRQATQAYGQLQESEGDSIKLACHTYQVVDRQQKQIGLVSTACYAFAFLALMFFRDNPFAIDVASLVASGLSFFAVSMTAFHFNMLDNELCIKARVARDCRSRDPEREWQAIS